MKKKKFNKKLALNKETISNLDKNSMNAINGGGTIQCTLHPDCNTENCGIGKTTKIDCIPPSDGTFCC